MTKLKPFKAWRYNLDKVGDLASVLAPPYDVIGPEKQEALYQKSPYNVCRIDLPRKQGNIEKYQVASETFEQWKQAGVLSQESQPSIYIYFQSFSLPTGERRTRRGFFARRRLETFEQGGVKPHERTFAGPKEDRLNLLKATHANLSPIFSLYRDPGDKVGPILEELAVGKPDYHVENLDGEEHRLWKISDPKKIGLLLDTIRDYPLMIADGHHRYETSLNYLQLKKASLGEGYRGDEDFNYVLMFFCSLQDPGLVVLPTHRVLTERPEVDQGIIRELLSRYGAVKEFSLERYSEALEYMHREGDHLHLIAWIHDDKIEVWSLDPEKLLSSESLNHLHLAVRDLDVTILHDLILEEIMGISKGAQREYGTIQYVKSAQETVQLCKEKKTYGFLLNPTKISQLEAITEIGSTMPQKSTFFFPKIPTGLLFYEVG